MTADRFSRCPGCGGCIRPDEEIEEGVDRRWYHEECVPELMPHQLQLVAPAGNVDRRAA